MTVATADPAAPPTIVRKGPERVDFPVLSPGGGRVAFQMMTREDWEIVVLNRDGTGETRVTRDIQHDVLPQFLTETRLVGMIGEPRHRRSFLYDLQTGSRTRLFHNNTVRTIAPEYSWDIEPRRQQDTARCRARRRHGLSRARGVPDGPRADGDPTGTASARRLEPGRRGSAARQGHAALRADRRGGQGDGRRGVGRPNLRLRESSVRLRLEAHHAAGEPSSPQPTCSRPTGRSATRRSSSGSNAPTRSAARRPTSSRRSRARSTPSSSTSSAATTTRSPSGPGADDDSSGTAALLETARMHGEAAAAGDDRLCVVHRRGSGTARQPRIRAAGRRRQAGDRRRAQQRHDRLGR